MLAAGDAPSGHSVKASPRASAAHRRGGTHNRRPLRPYLVHDQVQTKPHATLTVRIELCPEPVGPGRQRDHRQYIELPPEPSSARTVWTPSQAAQFLNASRADPLFAAYHLALVTGMRRGEVCGLRWVNVDLDRSQLRVSQAAVQVGGTSHFGPPKTRSGLRTIALDAGTVGVLRQHQLEQANPRAQWAVAGQTDLVFSRADGSVLLPERLSRKFKEAAVAAGLPVIRFHDLRHTSASLALAAGVALKTVSGRLGHSTTATSNA